MRSSPSSIEAILHIYYSPVPHERQRTAAMQQAYREFVSQGLIVSDGNGYFKCTPKGSAWVEMICHTPYPVKQVIWSDPRISYINKLQ